MTQSYILSLEARRTQVHQLILKGTASKLVRGLTGDAERYLREAYAITRQDELFPRPWRQLVEYRIAQLILRQDPDGNRLEEADELLARACEGGSIGPLPAIYRLAVLGRLQRECRKGARDVTLRQAFHQALDAVRGHRRGPLDAHVNQRVQNARIQDHYFNMLELSSYFLGRCYDDLEGLGTDPHTDLSPASDAWVLVGPDRKISEVVYSRELALVELEDRARIFPGAVLFRRSSDTNGFVWKYGRGGWKETRPSGALYLALVLSRRLTSERDLRMKVCSTDCSDNLRQVKSRLLRDIDALTGRRGSLVIVNDPEIRVPTVSPESAPVFGAVPWSLIR